MNTMQSATWRAKAISCVTHIIVISDSEGHRMIDGQGIDEKRAALTAAIRQKRADAH
jgi:hypothetical protein